MDAVSWRVRRGLTCAALVAGVMLYAGANEKYMIAHSWDLLAVSPMDVARNLAAWQKLPPDGVSLAIRKQIAEGVSLNFANIMNDPEWQREWLQGELHALQTCAAGGLKHNFLTTFWTPHQRLAWDDDDAWARFGSRSARPPGGYQGTTRRK